MIDCGNGKKISTIAVSTAMGMDGRGIFPLKYIHPGYRRNMRIIRKERITVFAKSSTYDKWRGNFNIWNPMTWRYVQRLCFDPESLVNGYDLTSGGIGKNVWKISMAQLGGFNVIPNYYPQFFKGLEVVKEEAFQAILRCWLAVEQFWALELNLSCPNSSDKIVENMDFSCKLVEAIKEGHPWLYIIAKTSIVHPTRFYSDLKNAGMDCIHMINTIPWDIIFPGVESPLADVGGGGVSGGVAHPIAYEYLQRAAGATDLPKIFGCGASDTAKVRRYLTLGKPGKRAVSICTPLRTNSKEAGKILDLNKGGN